MRRQPHLCSLCNTSPGVPLSLPLLQVRVQVGDADEVFDHWGVSWSEPHRQEKPSKQPTCVALAIPTQVSRAACRCSRLVCRLGMPMKSLTFWRMPWAGLRVSSPNLESSGPPDSSEVSSAVLSDAAMPHAGRTTSSARRASARGSDRQSLLARPAQDFMLPPAQRPQGPRFWGAQCTANCTLAATRRQQ